MRRASSTALAALICLATPALPAFAQDKERLLTITTTSALTTTNPYAETATDPFFIWCQVYGCLGRIDFVTKELKPVLLEKWEAVEPTRWRFTLRTDLKRHDGGPGPTSADVIHSWQRIMTDPASVQRYLFEGVTDVVAVSDSVFDIVTQTPNAQIPVTLFSHFIITSKDAYDKHGRAADNADRNGWGPYKINEYLIDQRVVLEKSELWPEESPKAPDRVVYTRILEPDQRVTALLNNEVQVATLVPPQLMDRLQSRPDVKIVPTGAIEPMFLAFNAPMEPWTDPRIRKAAAYAINKDQIIERLLFGLADRLDGPMGPNQLCYKEPSTKAINYDPDKARELLAEAGYPDGGPEITFLVPSGRYVFDRQIGEALAQMLREVGFKVDLSAPEFASMWADVRSGKAHTYYMGRGQAADLFIPLSQYFQTGLTPRTGYSNPELDALFEEARSSFDPDERCANMQKVVDFIASEVPAHFLWSHHLINGVAAHVEWPKDPSGAAWLLEVEVN